MRPRSYTVSFSAALASPGLSGLVQHARFLRQLDASVRAVLPESLSIHVQVANLHEDRLVMLAESAAWATRLRYQRQRVLQALWRDYSICCPALEVKVSLQAFEQNQELAKASQAARRGRSPTR